MGKKGLFWACALLVLFSSSVAGAGRVFSKDGAAPKRAEAAGQVDDMNLFASLDLGTCVSGLPVPAFIDQNGSAQQAYNIKSLDILLQAGAEKLTGKFALGGYGFDWGVRGRLGLAYTYWQTQQGDGEPGNYFCDNGFPSSQTGLHSGDMINIKGFWWAFAPEATVHYKFNEYFKAGASLGPCIFGYTGMTIEDPWSGYSTSISDNANVWHSDFLTQHLPGISGGIAMSLNLVLTPEKGDYRYTAEAGILGPAWNIGLGVEYPFSQAANAGETKQDEAKAAEKTESRKQSQENKAEIEKPVETKSPEASVTKAEYKAGPGGFEAVVTLGYQYLLMTDMENSMKWQSTNPLLHNYTYSAVHNGIDIRARGDMAFGDFYAGPSVDFLFCLPGYMKFNQLPTGSYKADIYGWLIPAEAGGGYRAKIGGLEMEAGIYAGNAWSTTIRSISVKDNPVAGDYDISPAFYGSSWIADAEITARFGEAPGSPVSYSAGLGYRYCIVDSPVTDQAYSTKSSNGTVISFPKGAKGGNMDFRGLKLNGSINYAF